jgi:hypothetical protein
MVGDAFVHVLAGGQAECGGEVGPGLGVSMAFSVLRCDDPACTPSHA